MSTERVGTEWLLAHQNRRLGAEEFIDGLIRRLLDAGIPLWRCATDLLTLHPEVFVRNILWRRGAGCISRYPFHDIRSTPGYLESPICAIFEGAKSVRARLDVPREQIPYLSLVELAEQGATDYLALPIEFSDGRRTYVSFATDRPGGFTDEDVQYLEQLLPGLSIRLELESAYYATRSLLEVYLGRNAARRVLAGAFRRGGGETIRAALLTCDLRGFTEMSDRLPVREVVSILDRYFECIAVPVAERGGEVLKFIGDAVLAIFPAESEAKGPCLRALAAARTALAAMEKLAAERTDVPLAIGLALHIGEVMYGNIGAPGRLDFTVIGPAVNEVCRVESLCKPLGVPLLMTARFASDCGEASIVSLGKHSLKGVKEPLEIFTLP